MFWGLIMEPKRRYTQTVQKSFHVSKAALDLHNSDDEPSQLILTYNNRNYLLCTLQKGQIYQCSLNLNFNVGDQICFATNGKCNIHLSGYLIETEFEDDEDEISEEETVSAVANKRKGISTAQQIKKKSKTELLLDDADNYNSEDDSTFNIQEAEEDSDEEVDDEEAEDEEGEDEEGSENDEEIEDNDNEEESSLSEGEDEPQPIMVDKKTSVNGVSKTSEKKKKKQKQKEQKQKEHKNLTVDKTPKSDTPNKTPKGSLKANTSEQGQISQKRTLEGGVVVQDLKVGDGSLVKPGKMVQVYYEGRLKQNNKMFDSNNKGPGFKFRVGKQEVIKGWDVGVMGMKVGGKRRISCPPAMAYGQKGSPPVIPPNSTLIFEVEVKNVI